MGAGELNKLTVFAGAAEAFADKLPCRIAYLTTACSFHSVSGWDVPPGLTGSPLHWQTSTCCAHGHRRSLHRPMGAIEQTQVSWLLRVRWGARLGDEQTALA